MKPQASYKTEHADPHEQHNPVPKIVLGLVAGLVVWAATYIWTEQAEGPAQLGDRRDLQVLAQGAAGGARAVDGKQLFAANCQACHQAAGQGLPGVFPPLAGSPLVTGDPVVLTQIVLHGLTGPLEILGTSYNGAMPAFGQQLSDAELAAVLTHIRSEWGNQAPAIEAVAVASARKWSESQTDPWHSGELHKLAREH